MDLKEKDRMKSSQYRLNGIVRVKIIGKSSERLLNQLVKNEIWLKNIKKISENEIHLDIKVADVKKLRYVIRDKPYKLYFTKRSGVVFWLAHLKKQKGFIAGSILFLILLVLLSNLIWRIKIEGADPTLNQSIQKELERLDVRIGSPSFKVLNPEQLQNQLQTHLSGVTWIGVKLEGSSLTIQVVQEKKPSNLKAGYPRNIVASKKGRVDSIIVEKGQRIVEVNDIVKKGQILVSGLIGKEEKKVKVPAKATVMAETWYLSNIEIPLSNKTIRTTGQLKHYYKLTLFNKEINSPFSSKNTFKEKSVEKNSTPFYFLRWKLPIVWEETINRETENITRNLTVEEAKAEGLKEARVDLMRNLPLKSKIEMRKILQQKKENGKVKLSIYYRVTENIASENPITQGD
jgi:similar to stage IV sporulation protein